VGPYRPWESLSRDSEGDVRCVSGTTPASQVWRETRFQLSTFLAASSSLLWQLLSPKQLGQRASEMCQTFLPHLRALVSPGVNRYDVHKIHHHITHPDGTSVEGPASGGHFPRTVQSPISCSRN
jgi:hypothetical protein